MVRSILAIAKLLYRKSYFTAISTAFDSKTLCLQCGYHRSESQHIVVQCITNLYFFVIGGKVYQKRPTY